MTNNLHVNVFVEWAAKQVRQFGRSNNLHDKFRQINLSNERQEEISTGLHVEVLWDFDKLEYSTMPQWNIKNKNKLQFRQYYLHPLNCKQVEVSCTQKP